MNVQPVSYSRTNFNGFLKPGKYYPWLNEIILPENLPEGTKIMDRLPFTAKQFWQYTKNRLNITKERVIDRFYVGKGLSVIL